MSTVMFDQGTTSTMVADDGDREAEPTSQPDDGSWPDASRQSIATALERITHATQQAGIRRELIEGAFVSALMAAIAAVGRAGDANAANLKQVAKEVAEQSHASLKAMLDANRAAVEQQLASAEATYRTANKLVTAVRQSAINVEVTQSTIVARMVEKALPQMLVAVRQGVVLREQGMVGERRWRRYAMVGVATLVVATGGFAASRWQDQAALAATAECLAHPLTDGHRFYCDLSRLLPVTSPDTANQTPATSPGSLPRSAPAAP